MIARLGIGKKLFFINGLAALVTLLVASGLLLYKTWVEQNQVFQKRIQQQGVLVASNITAAIVFEDWQAADEILTSLRSDPAVEKAEVLDGKGEIKSSFQTDTPQPGTKFWTAVPVLDGSERIGLIRIEASNFEIVADFRNAVVSVLALTILSLALGLALSSRVQGIVTIPIRQLSQLARQVRRTNNYSLRIDPIYPDEIGSLTEDMNAMLEIIERRDRNLESSVAARTRELEQRNEELRVEITEREKAERERREIQERFEKAFRNAPIGMAIVRADGTILQRNGAVEELLGIDVATHLSLKDFVSREHYPQLEEALELMREGPSDSVELELQCNDDAGKTLFCVLSFSAIRGDAGAFRYSVLQIQDITEAKELSTELNYQATHDALTGLGNRRVFERTLKTANEQCEHDGRHFALCLLDLDQFKAVNDTCGHQAGDDLLTQIAQLLLDCVRSDDLVVRLGGDEFAVMLHDCGADKARQVSESMRAAVEQFVFNWEGSAFRVGVSIGVVVITSPSKDTSQILRTADAACFTAKDAGRNQVYLVEGTNEEISSRHGEMHWVQRIHQAIDKEDFVLFCQPVLPLVGEEDIQRLEVLIRLRDRKKGVLVPPGAFLPVAERYDLASKLDEWVVKHLIKLLKGFSFLFEENRKYWVNLSGRSIGDPRFLKILEETIEAAKLPPGVLNFEITETAVIRNVSEAVEVMTRLKAYGCQFALDDFGSGLSSFGYLRTLPVDYIKIDGMFVRDIADDRVDRIFVKSIIDIARVMGVKSIAECVESEEILGVVKELGADYGQGFALGRPRELLPQGVITPIEDEELTRDAAG